jgi:threonine/homoserine/homoserine lactone efflux protein
MDSFLLRGILIGLFFGVPAGAVGTMAAQRTLNNGARAGLITGLGSSIVDCLYACISAFGLSFISDFLLHYQKIINILGGCLILIMGIRQLIPNCKNARLHYSASGGIKMFLSSFAVAITNPAAILTFLFAFTYFWISGQTGIFQGIQLVNGVFVGTYIWWVSLCLVLSLLKNKAEIQNIRTMNIIFGLVLCIFGTVVFIRALY